MMRAAKFRYVAPKSLGEALSALAEPGAMPLAGGTDLVPNLKRRQQQPPVVVSLRNLAELRGVDRPGSLRDDGGSELRIGAMTTLTELVRDPAIAAVPALHRAVAQVASPLLRTTATLGGNLCLDTRCNYYDQNEDWRKSIDFCRKAPGPVGIALPVVGKDDDGVCWVAPSSSRCWAVSSTDSAPALIALGASIDLASREGTRTIPLEALYDDDGMAFLTKAPHELLTAVHVPLARDRRSTYWKLRRRGSFDFPVLGVAASVTLDGDTVTAVRIVLGAVTSRPIVLEEAATLVGRKLTDAAVEEMADAAGKAAKPLDNTDFLMTWRKTMAKSYVAGALRQLRGDAPESFGAAARNAMREIPATW